MDTGPAKLKEALKLNERTPSWLSRKLMVHPSSVTRWLSGDYRPREKQRRSMEEMFGIKADEWGRE